MRNFKPLAMAASLLFNISLLFLQLLAITSHARTLSEKPPTTAFSLQITDDLEIPKSPSPPLPASPETTLESSSLIRRMWATQVGKPAASPPPPGPVPSTRPPSPAECFCTGFPRSCIQFTPTTGTSPCYGKLSVARQKGSNFNSHHYAAEGLHDNFSSGMDS